MTPLKRTAILPILGCIFLCVGGALHLLTGCHNSALHSNIKSESALSNNAKASKKRGSFSQKGYASWYGGKFHGRLTASGAVYNMHAFTAAHRTLPLNSYVRVTNLENNRRVIVKINDRGPFGVFRRRRVIDLSYAAARALDMHKKGRVPVLVETISAETATKRR